MGCVTKEVWLIFERGKTDFCPFPNVQTGPGAHIGTCLMGTACSFEDCCMVVIMRCNFIPGWIRSTDVLVVGSVLVDLVLPKMRPSVI